MALKDKWANTGKSIGGAFKNFGKAVATTTKVAVGKEENDVQENGKSRLKDSWTNVGHGFGDAGKNIGTAAKGTVDKVAGKEDEENKKDAKPSEEEVIDVDSKMSESEEK